MCVFFVLCLFCFLRESIVEGFLLHSRLQIGLMGEVWSYAIFNETSLLHFRIVVRYQAFSVKLDGQRRLAALGECLCKTLNAIGGSNEVKWRSFTRPLDNCRPVPVEVG